jgi:hypothetical protein
VDRTAVHSLFHAVFVDLDIGGLEMAHQMPLFVADNQIQHDFRGAHVDQRRLIGLI